jgi:leucyl/phenylalanyl-tRNA--protein transferase
MTIYRLPEEHIFPPVSEAEPNGLLGVGGDLNPDRVMKAYSSGIFPWYSRNQPILWFAPDPRFVIFPEELKIQRSLKKVIKKNIFEIRINTQFKDVIEHCSEVPRPGQFGTWITEDMKQSYIRLHQEGYSHSFEAFQDGKLVGGLYGIVVGSVFAGESMFAQVSDSSKVAFVWAVRQMIDWGIKLIDCQVYTEHLDRFGAREIPRAQYMKLLRHYKNDVASIGSTFEDEFYPL